MRNILATLIVVLSYLNSQAQMPDTTAFKAQQSALRSRRNETLNHIKTAKTNISELKTEYKAKDRDSSFAGRMTVLTKERCYWKDEYRSWKRADDKFAKDRETFDRSMLRYYRTQPFFKYRNRSHLNTATGIALLSTGGLVFLGGLINAMGESPGAAPAVVSEQERKEHRIMAVCVVAGSVFSLSSIPFFRAAHRNKVRYESHIVWNIDVSSIGLPNGYKRDVVGLKARIPLFSH